MKYFFVLLRSVSLAALTVLLSASASAAQLLSESFNYPAGSSNLAGQNGGTGWGAAWQLIDGGSADVSAGNLVAGSARSPAGYDGISNGNKAFLANGRRVGRVVDTSAAGAFGVNGYRDGNGRIGADGKTLYISFMQQPNGTALFYEFEFHRDSLGDPGRFAGIGNDQGGDNVNLRAPNGVHTFVGPGNTGVNFYVVRIDFKAGDDDVWVYMNPTSTTEPASPTLFRAAATDMSFNGVSFGAFVNGITVTHDEIRMGQTWADVTAAPPVAPVILSDPQPKTLIEGSNAVMTVTASGVPAPTFQWFKGTDPVAGQTSATLTLQNVQLSDAGQYSAKATNATSTVTSAAAQLTVTPRPVGLLAYEGFAYPTGNNNLPGKQDGLGWSGSWAAVYGPGLNVTADSLAAGTNAPPIYDTYATGNKVFVPNTQRDGRFLDLSPGGLFASHGYRDATGNIGADGKTIYISFMQQPSSTQAFYEFEFHRGDLGDPGRIGGVGNDLGGASTVNLRTAGVQTPIGQGSTSVNFYVVRIDYKPGFDDVRVYMNPTSLDEPPTASLTMLAASDMSFNGISFGAFLNGVTVNHDELRLGETWESVTPSAPSTTPLVGNLGATAITSSGATINGGVTRVGSDTPTVTIYYGTTDGGNNAGSWQNSVSVGAQTGAFTQALTGLDPYTRYYYRAFAQNSSGGNFSSVTLDFPTLPAPPVLANLAPTEVSTVTARLGATITSAGGKAPLVTLYYGTADGGTNPAAWQHSVSLGALTDQGSTVIGGLTANTGYFYRVFGVNEGGGAWAPSTASFTTPVGAAPTVSNLVAGQINGFSATLLGQLTSTGKAPTTVTLFYGPVDGGTNAGAWAKSVEIGLQTGNFNKIISGLTTSTTYFIRARAQNSAGVAWSPASGTFSTTGFTPVTVYLNEFVVATDNDDPHPYRDEDGSPEDWIELYNPSGTAADIGGYYLTDESNKLTKWRFPVPTIIPADSYLVVFASNKNRAVNGFELHTNFKLAAEGEYLAFVQPNGTTVVKQFSPAFPAVPEYWSYGLTLPSSGGNYLAFQIPTPGAANSTSAGTPSGEVIFSLPSQAFGDVSVSLTLTTASPTAAIRYTTDRTAPTAASALYTGSLTISTTTQIRARTFEPGAGFAPGLVHSETYTKLGAAAAAFTSNLPVVVLNNFNGGRPDADKEMSWSMYSPKVASGNRTALTNAPDFTTRGRMKVRGSSSAGWPKYSMNIEAWDELNEDVDVSPLGMAPEADWVLGSFYTSDPAMMRNPFMYEMSNRIGRWAPHTKYVEVFANTNDGTVDYPGDYMGVYAIMEKPERGANRIPVERLNPNDLDASKISGGYIIRVDRVEPGTAGWVTNRNFPAGEPFGSISRLVYDYPSEEPAPAQSIPPAQSAYIRGYVQEFEDAIVQTSRTNPDTGKYYTDYIDRNSWVDHGLLNILAGNVDGLRLSTFMHKPRNGKLIAGPIWDFDLTMNSTDGRSQNPLNYSSTGPGDATNLLTWGWWKYLYPDPDFWQQFVDRWETLREGPLADASIATQLAGYQAQLNEAAVRNYQKWPTGLRDGPDADTAGSYADEVDLLRTWLVQHTAWIDSQLVPKPVQSPAGGQVGSVTVTAAQGTIYYTLDGTDPRQAGGTVSSSALTLTSGSSIAIASGTQIIARAKSASLWSAPSSGYYFTSPAAAAGNIVVSELNYHPADPSTDEQAAGITNSDDFEFIELLNLSTGNVDLGGSRFTAGIDFTFPANSILTPGQRILVVASRAALAVRYPLVTSASIAGEYRNDHFDNAGEFVRLESAAGVEILSFTYGTSGQWPVEADGGGRSLVLNQPQAGSNLSSALSWRASSTVGGSPVTTDALSYAAWKTAAGIVSDTADGDRDGLVALVEYAIGTDPARPDATGLPTLQLNGTGQWQVTLTRALVAEDTSFALQTSSPDVSHFTDAPFVIDSRSVNGTREVITGHLTTPPNGQQMFLRVRWFTNS